MKKILSLLFISLFIVGIPSSLQAQELLFKQWDKAFGGNRYDAMYTIEKTTDGGYLIGGISDSDLSFDKSDPCKGSGDYWIVKVDANGNKQWDKTYGGDKFDQLFTIIQTADGGYLLGGESATEGNGDKTEVCRGQNDYWIIKLDNNGNKLWDRTYGGRGLERLQTLQETADGYILGGYSDSWQYKEKSENSKGGYDFWIIKIDAKGDIIWDKTLGGSGDDRLSSIHQALGGGYIVGGYSDSGINGDKTQASRGKTDYWVVKMDSTGNKVWDKTYGGNFEDNLLSLLPTSDGGYILGGYSQSWATAEKSGDSRSNDYWILKIDANGNKLWDKTFGGDNLDILAGIVQTPDGGYLLGGWSGSDINGNKTQASRGNVDYWLIKVDSKGTFLWDRTYGGTGEDNLRCIQATKDGGVILGGYSNSTSGFEKTDYRRESTDFWIVKLGPELPEVPELIYTISPNPSNGSFRLKLKYPTALPIEITAFNLLGKVEYKQQFNAKNLQELYLANLPLAKGLYVLQIKKGEITVREVIIIE